MSEESANKALELAQTSAVGSAHVFIGKTLSTVILAVGTIVLTILIAPTDYGLYVIALIPASFIILFQDFGVGAALVRFCAQYRSAKRTTELRTIIRAGYLFEITTGIILTTIAALISNFLASSVFGKPQTAILMILISATIILTAITSASQNILIGFERMKPYSVLLLCQAVTQTAVSPLLVFLGYGALGVAIGYTFSLLFSALVSACIVYFTIYRKIEPLTVSNSAMHLTLKSLLNYGLPLTVGSVTGASQTIFYNFVAAIFLTAEVIGNLKTASNFAVLLALIMTPVSVVLFPAFSKIDPTKESQLLRSAFRISVKYCALFIAPATLALIVLSPTFIGTLYGNKWPYASLFLSLSILNYLMIVFGSQSLYTLLTAMGRTRIVMELYILTFAVGAPLALLLIPRMGMVGLLTVLIFDGIPSMIIGLFYIWKHYETKIDFKSSTKILLASTIASAVTYLLLTFLNTVEWVRLAVGVCIFLAVYLTTAPLIGAITQSDVTNLRSMFSNSGIVSRSLEIPLLIVEKSLKITRQSDRKESRSTSAHKEYGFDQIE
jgi:O-antigen/teichoic acid export membrane protein